MTELTIDRLSATAVVEPDSRGVAEARLQRMLTRLADNRLDNALSGVPIPDGDWYIKRLDIPLVLQLERSDSSIEIDWAQALVGAIAAAIQAGTGDVVRYRRRADALADLIVSVARQYADREWAWRQMGLLQAGDPSPLVAPLDSILAAGCRVPAGITGTLITCVNKVGLVALHRVLGTRGWTELARIACESLGVDVGQLEGGGSPISRSDSPGPSRQPAAYAIAASEPDRPLHRRRAEEALDRALLAEEVRRMQIRLGDQEARCLAILAIAEADPSCLMRSGAAKVVREAAELLCQRGPTPRLGLAASHSSATAHHTPPPATPAPGDAARAEDGDPVEDDPTEAVGLPTLWAGLLFFLNTAAAVGIPDELLDDPVLASRPLWWLMTRVVQQMIPVAADDPAVLAIAGLLPNEVVAAEEASDDEVERIEGHARRWMDATAARMHSDDDPAQICARLALRRGTITVQRGWIAVTLDIDEVEIDVRRAGLDIDPGWVPWLGAVVRLSYE